MSYTAATVNAWYQAVQFRDGPAATVASTVALLNSGGITPANAQLSVINDSFTNTYVNPIVRIYQASFGRVPDQAGQNFWVDSFAAGTVTPLTAATQFANSTEFNATYGANASSPINAAVLTAFYQNVLNRAPDAAGYQFWLNSGQTVAQVLNFFAQSTEFTLASASAINQFQQAEINLNPATTGSLFQYGGFPTDSVALTTGVDTLNLLKNTTVTGIVNTTALSTDTTFQAFDTITGAAGTTNNLNVTVIGTGGANTLAPATVSGVQNINIRALGTDLVPAATATTVAAGNFVGAQTFNSNLSTSALIVAGLAAGQAVGIIGNGSTTNAALTATYGGTVTTGTLNLATGVTGAPAVTINGGAALTTLNVNSFSAINNIGTLAAAGTVTTVNVVANTALTTAGAPIGITGGAITTINVSGGASNVSSTVAAVTLGTLAGAVTTVDASKLVNGGISATLNGLTTIKVTGGAGNDSITTGAVLGTGSVDAGAGTGDRLINATNLGYIASSAVGAKYTNFEIFQNSGITVQNASFVTGINAVEVNQNAAGSGFSGLTQTQANAVTYLQTSLGSSLNLSNASGASDSLTITASSSAGPVNVAALQTLGTETLSYTNSSTAASTLSFGGLAAASAGLKTVNIAGGKGVTLDLAAASSTSQATTITTIDASKLTAQTSGTNTFTLQDTIGGHALTAGLTITGSAGDDAFSLGTIGLNDGVDTIASGLVTINGGVGTDVLTASLGQLFTGGSGALAFNGGDGTKDKLIVADAAAGAVADATFANLSNVEQLQFSNTGAISLTSGGFFNTAFANGVTITDGATTTNAVTFDLSLYGQKATITNVGTTGVQTIIGGSAADTISVTSAAVGTGLGTVIARGNAGADTITVADTSAITVGATIQVTGGTGADVITQSGVTNTAAAVSYVRDTIAVGDSIIGAADQINGYFLQSAAALRTSDTLDFALSSQAAGVAATAVTGYTVPELTFTVAGGILSFAGTKASSVTTSLVESVWTTQIAPLQANGATLAWVDTVVGDVNNGNTIVFNNDTVDSQVILVGNVAATALNTVAANGTILIG